MNKTIFIQANHRQFWGAKLAQYSFIRHRKSNSFNVEILRLQDFPQLYQREGLPYLRNGRKVIWNNDDLQSFTPLRFLPPQLLNYQGMAVVVDPDVFALGDPMELFEFPLAGKAMACHYKEGAEGKSFKSSVMLLQCELLREWEWDRHIEEIFSLKRDYRSWMGLEWMREESIVRLPEYWNDCDKLTNETRFIHYTLRKTQPWKTGLPVDFKYDPPKGRLAFFKQLLVRNLRRSEYSFYQPNPHNDQIQLFLSLAKEAHLRGHLSIDFTKEEMEKGYIRSDLIEQMETVV